MIWRLVIRTWIKCQRGQVEKRVKRQQMQVKVRPLWPLSTNPKTPFPLLIYIYITHYIFYIQICIYIFRVYVYIYVQMYINIAYIYINIYICYGPAPDTDPGTSVVVVQFKFRGHEAVSTWGSMNRPMSGALVPVTRAAMWSFTGCKLICHLLKLS